MKPVFLVLRSGERAIRFRPALRITAEVADEAMEVSARAVLSRNDASSMKTVLNRLGIAEVNPGVFDGEWRGGGQNLRQSIRPSTAACWRESGKPRAEDYEHVVSGQQEAFFKWRTTPAPERGETVRQLGNALRDAKQELGKLVTLERARSSPKAKAKCRR